MQLKTQQEQRQFLKCMHLQLTKSSLIKHETKVVIWTDWNGKEEKCTRWIKLLFSVQQDELGIIWVESVKFTAGRSMMLGDAIADMLTKN